METLIYVTVICPPGLHCCVQVNPVLYVQSLMEYSIVPENLTSNRVKIIQIRQIFEKNRRMEG
jgi:hypothetical protein